MSVAEAASRQASTDPRPQYNLLSPGSKQFIHVLGGGAILTEFTKVLTNINIMDFPCVTSSTKSKRIDEQKLRALNACVSHLAAPKGVVANAALVRQDRALFTSSSCTNYHITD